MTRIDDDTLGIKRPEPTPETADAEFKRLAGSLIENTAWDVVEDTDTILDVLVVLARNYQIRRTAELSGPLFVPADIGRMKT